MISFESVVSASEVLVTQLSWHWEFCRQLYAPLDAFNPPRNIDLPSSLAFAKRSLLTSQTKVPISMEHKCYLIRNHWQFPIPMFLSGYQFQSKSCSSLSCDGGLAWPKWTIQTSANYEVAAAQAHFETNPTDLCNRRLMIQSPKV